MNCKPGDLAFVINDDPPCKSNIGKIVKVLKPAGRYAKHGEWLIEPTSPDHLIVQMTGKRQRVLRFADVAWEWIVMTDRDLRPIRDSDGQDETLTWKPLEVKEPA